MNGDDECSWMILELRFMVHETDNKRYDPSFYFMFSTVKHMPLIDYVDWFCDLLTEPLGVKVFSNVVFWLFLWVSLGETNRLNETGRSP